MTNTLELSDVLKPISRIIRGESALEAISSSTPLNYNGKYTPRPKDWDNENSKYREAEEFEKVADKLRNHYPVQHPVGHEERDYNDLGSYLGSLGTVQDYYKESGKILGDYLNTEGRDSYNIVGVAQKELGNAVAAVAIYGDDAALVLSEDFENDLDKMAAHYQQKGINVSRNEMKRLALDHEQGHMYQKGMDFKKLAKEYGLATEEMAAEYDVETTLKGFYERQALAAGNPEVNTMYKNLAAVCADRAANVESNYSGHADAA
ncbi:hypothetical protein KY329_02515 [Candidatus Woesearchaeota archaeon]|nr:hypothetical protein [Candidatus Woesearchaeota archaeon]